MAPASTNLQEIHGPSFLHHGRNLMPGLMRRLRRFLRELRRRNVYRVAVACVAVAFVGLQAMDLLIPATTLPAWADELVLAFLIVGFPVSLVVARAAVGRP